MKTVKPPGSPLPRALILLAALAVAALAVETSSRWRRLEETVRSRSIPGSTLGITGLSKALQELGLLYPVPRARDSEQPAARLGSIPARRGSIPDQLSVDLPDRQQLLSAYGLGGLGQVPVLALLIPEATLNEIHASPLARGRQAEHAGYVGWFEEGSLRLSSGVGIRIHGGSSRRRPRHFNYRLIFRRRYGEPAFVPAPFAAREEHPPKRLVVKSDRAPDLQGRRWSFSDPIASEIVRQVGVPAPRMRPVRLVLNGEPKGLFTLSEYLGRDFLQAYYGHDEFTLVRTKQNIFESGSPVKLGDENSYREFQDWVLNRSRYATLQEAEAWVDVDNLYRWIIAMGFVGNQDLFQGALVRDMTDPSRRWFWIAWDLDVSVGLPWGGERGLRYDALLERVFRGRSRDFRKVLLWWLLRMPEQRRRFVELAADVLNHRIRPAFLQETLSFYRDQAALFRIPESEFLDEMEEFLRRRPEVYRRQLREIFDLGPSRRVRVSGPPGSQLEIDGYPTALPWLGEYFAGMTMRLAVPPTARATFGGFLLDGAPMSAEPDGIEITVRSDHQVQLLQRQPRTASAGASSTG